MSDYFRLEQAIDFAPPEEIRQILTSVSLSVCKACKEIPEFVTNHLDRDTLFRSIIEKE